MSEDLASAAPPLSVLHCVPEALQFVIGSIDESKASDVIRQVNLMAPQRVTVAVNVIEDEIDGLSHILGRAAFRTSLA
jgi:hypothetical protein